MPICGEKIHQPQQKCQWYSIPPQQTYHQKKALTYVLSKQLICIRCSVLQAASSNVERPKSLSCSLSITKLLHPIRKGVQLKNLAFSAAAPTYMMPHGVPSAGDWALDRYSAVFLQGTQKTLIDGCTWTRKFTSKWWHINWYWKPSLSWDTILRKVKQSHWLPLLVGRHSFSSPTECFRTWRSSEQDSTNFGSGKVYWQGRIQKKTVQWI